MRVTELIAILQGFEDDLEVELAVVAPPEGGDVTVDRYSIEGVLAWEDEEVGEDVVWLVGGEDDNVDTFLDAVEEEAEEIVDDNIVDDGA
jgi:hypothetical protein